MHRCSAARRRACLALLALSLTACGNPFNAWPEPSTRIAPTPCPLPSDPRTHDATRDADGDCLDDDAEHALAEWFTPWFRFDSRENARRPDEPVLVFQATSPDACDGGTSIELRYAYLFADDGGYATSTTCHDAHHGDNQYIVASLTLHTETDVRATVEYVIASGFYWPRHDMHFEDGRHPLLFLSAGKHHPFVDTSGDGDASPYSSWGCVDGIDGAGDLVRTTIAMTIAPRGCANVGERALHPADAFVGDLGAFGYAGENAWAGEPFCGGRPREGCSDEVSTMESVWR